MRVSVIGCGHLGAVHAAVLARFGHDVVGVDANAALVDDLGAARAPFFEPSLEPLLAEGLASQRLRFTTDIAEAASSEVHFICVGTPASAQTGRADLSALHSAFGSLLPHLGAGALVVGKSTVPVGTSAELIGRLDAVGARLAWNPEFLREGRAVDDSLAPDRIVVGVEPGTERSVALLREVYAENLAAGTPFIVTDLATAELAKGAANAFLATKVSFMNLMADIADAAGADVTGLAEILGHDPRIGSRYLGAGIGFGGGCLPKDLSAFAGRAEELCSADRTELLRAVAAINSARPAEIAARAAELAGGSLAGRRVAVLGIAFKPDSDDVRASPALAIADSLSELGAEVVMTDPAALGRVREQRPELRGTEDWREAMRDAHLTLLATEWAEYRRIDPVEARALVAEPVIYDGRNCLDRGAWRAAGWRYAGVGRR